MNHQLVELTADPNEPETVLFTVSAAIKGRTFAKLLLSKMVTTERHSPTTAEEVSKNFALGLEKAKKTLTVTTQRCMRHAVHPVHKQYRTDQLALCRKGLVRTQYMDTLVIRHQSLKRNRYIHLVTNGKYTTGSIQ